MNTTTEKEMAVAPVSLASRLVRKNPSPSYGHGWIVAKEGKRWHPCHSQAELLAGLTGNGGKKTWVTRLRTLLSR